MKLSHIFFSYGEKTVLQDFSLSLPDSGITALSGPSGCGKTTLFRLILKLETPERGIIMAPPPREIAILFQENRFLPGLDAKGQISAVLPKASDPTPWLSAVGLEEEASALPHTLSGGMQRSLALARCLAYSRGKSMLLLDEPFTGVDAHRAERLMEVIRSMGIPALYTSHDSHALALADSVISFSGPPLMPE